MSEKAKVYTYKQGDLVWAKMPSYSFWPGRISEPNTSSLAKMKKSPTQQCIFFFGSNNYGWVEEKNVRPYLEYRDEYKDKGKPKDQFSAALIDIDSYIENPGNFSALFEVTPIQKKSKSTPKPKKQDFDADFDSLKSDSSVPSSPSVSKTSLIETPKPVKQRTSSVRSTEKPHQKVPEAKRKATRESEDNAKEVEMDIEEPPTAKKARKSNNASATPTATAAAAATARNASTSSSGGGRRSEAGTEKALKSPRRSAVVDSSGEIYGIIGLGIMGTSILKKLLESGHEVVIFNRTPSRCDEFTGSQRCSIVSTPREVFEQAHITFVCVSDCDAVKEVVCDGALGIIAADTGDTDKGLVMFSSIDLETTADIQNAMMIKGSVRYLEAQIQGSRESAQNAELIIVASGDRSLYDDSKKCFDAIAKNTYFLSEEIGVAIKMNLVLQTIAGVQLAALGEALSLADTLGLQQRDILEIISLSNLNSEFIYQKGEVITNEKYREPSMKVDTMQKDMKMAIEFGDSLEQPLPLVAAAKELFKSAKRMGFGNDDSAAIYYATNFNKYCYDLGNAYENGNI